MNANARNPRPPSCQHCIPCWPVSIEVVFQIHEKRLAVVIMDGERQTVTYEYLAEALRH